MKLMKTEDAIGQVLCHDITQIIPGVTKDAVFRKGHIITEEDIPPSFEDVTNGIIFIKGITDRLRQGRLGQQILPGRYFLQFLQ